MVAMGAAMAIGQLTDLTYWLLRDFSGSPANRVSR